MTRSYEFYDNKLRACCVITNVSMLRTTPRWLSVIRPYRLHRRPVRWLDTLADAGNRDQTNRLKSKLH